MPRAALLLLVTPCLAAPPACRADPSSLAPGKVRVLMAQERPAGPQPAAGLALTSPLGAESWAADSLHYLTWTSAAAITSVTVECSTDAGQTWAVVSNATDGAPAGNVASAPDQTNKLLWRLPPQPGVRYRLRVRPEGQMAPVATSADFTIVPSQQKAYRWTEVTLQAPFAGRDGAGAVTFHGRMWLLGGWNPGDKVHFPKICNSEVWSSADGLEWRLEVAQAPWEGRHTAGYVVHDGKIWIVGGDANQHHYQRDVWCTPDGANWTLVTDRVPWGPRVLHHTVAFHGRIFVLGGQTLPQFAPDPPEAVIHNDIWSSADGKDWTCVAEDAPWSPRGMIGGSAVFQDRIWLLGGGTYDTPAAPQRQFFSDVWSSPDGADWQRHVEFAPWAPRQYHDVAVYDGRLWVMEGYDGHGNRKDVWYSADGVNWYELPDTPWAPRHAASVFVHDGALWMFAGNNMFPDVWRLTPAP